MTKNYYDALLDKLKTHGDAPIPGLVNRLSFEGMETEGTWGLYVPDRPNTVLWHGLSEEAASVMSAFLGRNDVDPRPLSTTAAVMIFGWEGLPMLSLPIADEIDDENDFSDPHWLPLTIAITRPEQRYEPRQRIFKRVAFTRTDKITAWGKSDGHCWYCGARMNPFGDFSIDHVHPVACGGTNDPSNLVPCCLPCNLEKKAMPLEQFRDRRGGKAFWFETQGGAA